MNTLASISLPPAPPVATPARVAVDADHEAARATLARDVFRSALVCLIAAAVLGATLRGQLWRGWLALDFKHLLHAHSHLALLGWVGNGFLALALHTFLPAADAPAARRVWLLQLVAIAGMTTSFLIAGYGPASIAFCTLHLGGSVWLAWRLRHAERASPLARDCLRVAVTWLALSCIGPLLLGPLAAAGWRDEAPYRLALHLYLHGLARGWMPFFLIATFCQTCAPRLRPEETRAAREALAWLAAGSALGFASPEFSTTDSPWLNVCAALGAIAGLAGAWGLVRALRPAWRATTATDAEAPRWMPVALGAFFLQGVLLLAATAPGLGWLSGHRQAQIAFLHLGFLCVVSPLLLRAGFAHGWWPRPRPARLAGWAFLAAALAGEALLALLIFGRAPSDPGAWLLGGSLALGAAVAALGFSAFRPSLALPASS